MVGTCEWAAPCNSCLIAYANSESSGEAWDLRASMSQIPMPSEWLSMRIWNLTSRRARRHVFAQIVVLL